MLRASITRGSAAVLTVLILVIGLISPTSAVSAPGVRILGTDSGVAIPGRYIVVLKDSATAGMAARAGGLTGTYGGKVKAVYERVLSGFAVEMSEAEALRLAADPQVAYVEQDQVVHLADTQENPPSWGLDRIDQRTLPLDTTYSYEPDAAPVTAYIIDTGIRITHDEFGGRASHGWDFVDNDPTADDCHGHGTRMAGIVGGKTTGVAKNVKLTSLRAFDCLGQASESMIVNAINWASDHSGSPAVVNMSLGLFCVIGGTDTPAPCDPGDFMAIKTAIANLIAMGMTTVVSAGNKNIDACGAPFNQVTKAIRVGAVTTTDTKLPTSSWGSCVDLWAPGQLIFSSTRAGNSTFSNESTGSSAAAAHVTGAVARMMARPGPVQPPSQVKAQLLAETTPDVITGLPAGSPNKLLYTPAPPVVGGSSVALARHQNGHLALFGVNKAGTLFYRSQGQVNSEVWSGWIQSTSSSWYSVCAATDNANRLKLIGLRRNDEVWHRSQAAINTDAFTILQKFDGLLNSCAVASDGTKLKIFGTNAQGQAFTRSEITPQGAYTPWTLMSGVPALRSVAAERNGNGQVEVFGLSRTGQIWHCWDTANNCPAGSWFQLDGQLSTIALARNQLGLLTIFGVNATGQLFQRVASPGTNNWSNWAELDVPATVGTLRSVAAEANAGGRITLIAVNLAGEVWQRTQTVINAPTYGPWTKLDGLLRP